jgi:hypothetical protein
MVGGVNNAPTIVALQATTTGVCVKNGAVSNCSDRNVKQDFGSVNPSEILNKIIQLPLSEWSYTNTPAIRHVGPMAQDFYSSFNVGEDDRHIATIDESGVALAAIQGLNQKMETENATLRAENVNLKKRLERLEWLMESKMAKAE